MGVFLVYPTKMCNCTIVWFLSSVLVYYSMLRSTMMVGSKSTFAGLLAIKRNGENHSTIHVVQYVDQRLHSLVDLTS